MGFGSLKDAPDVPDTMDLAKWGTGTNFGTTNASTVGGYVGSKGPFGQETKLKKTGTYKYKDPYTGKTMKVPKFTEKLKLSPAEKERYHAMTGAQGEALAAGSAGLDELTNPLDLGEFDFSGMTLGNEATESRLFELGSKRLDPKFARDRARVETDLVNRGIMPGSRAYELALNQQGQEENDAYNQLLLTGRGQASDEIAREWESRMAGRAQSTGEKLATRGSRLQEIMSLLGLGMTNPATAFNMPQKSGYAPNAYPIMDIPGLINQNWDQQFKAWQAESQATQGLFGGLLGMAGNIFASDERIKEDMTVVGKTAEGLPIYEFRIGDGPLQTGVSAQDVEKVDPDLVMTTEEGIKAVDYGQLDTDGAYVVKKGDNLTEIAERFNVPLAEIVAANQIDTPDYIVPGQKIVIPGMAEPGAAAMPVVDGRLEMPAGAMPGAPPPPIGGMGMPVAQPAAPPVGVNPTLPAASPRPMTPEARQAQLDQFADQGLDPWGRPRPPADPAVMQLLDELLQQQGGLPAGVPMGGF